MFFKKILGQAPKGETSKGGVEETKGLRPEIRALAKIGAQINAQKKIDVIWELVARESLTALQAHRSTIFAPEEKSSGLLKTPFTFSSDPLNDQVGVFEEKEVARKVLKQKKLFWLKGPEDFSEFFKYESRERKITALISIPLLLQGKATGVISVVLINSEKGFDEGSLQLLSIFANQVSLAMENDFLRGEVYKVADFRKDYERYLDDILLQLQNLSQGEQRRIQEHIGSLFQATKTDSGPSPEPAQQKEADKGDESAGPGEEKDIRPQEKDPMDGILRVVMEDGSLSLSDDLVGGGVFIRTPNPFDLVNIFP